MNRKFTKMTHKYKSRISEKRINVNLGYNFFLHKYTINSSKICDTRDYLLKYEIVSQLIYFKCTIFWVGGGIHYYFIENEQNCYLSPLTVEI